MHEYLLNLASQVTETKEEWLEVESRGDAPQVRETGKFSVKDRRLYDEAPVRELLTSGLARTFADNQRRQVPKKGTNAGSTYRAC